MTSTLLVTRPEPQAGQWVERLRELGVRATALPLLRIAPLADDGRVRDALSAHPEAVIFVSPNAVSRFFASIDGAWRWPVGVIAAGPGPGTAAALLKAGVPVAAVIAPGDDAPAFDAASLWELLRGRSWAGRRVLIVQGQDGREDLRDWFSNAGARVDTVVVYVREAAVLDDALRATLRAALDFPSAHTWLFASAQSLPTLEREAPGASWASARAIATHARIAQAVREFGFGRVECVTAGVEAVAAAMTAMAKQGAKIQ